MEGMGGDGVFVELQRLSLFAKINSVLEVQVVILSQIMVPTQVDGERARPGRQAHIRSAEVTL